MKRLMMVLATMLVAAGLATVAAQNTAQVDKLVAAAQHKETVDGDLKGAIDAYKKVVDTAGGNRAVAAQALVRMAECYQKLGDLEARNVYERIVQQYPDQKEAVAIARAHVGGARSVAQVKGDRSVWTGPGVDLFGTVSPDGRFLTYVDWSGSQNLMLRDLVANTSRPLTAKTGPSDNSVGDFSVISRDGSQVAFWWAKVGAGEFRVASLKGTGIPAARVVRTGEYLRPFDWSPDGKWVAVLIDERRIGVVSVEDGTLRQLKSIDWQGVDKMVFSPDGRFVAYDLANADRPGRRDVVVIAADGTSEVAVVADAFRNYLMGWSPAGDVVFSSDRSGTRSLWTVRVQSGRPQAEPRLVKENVKSTRPLGLTPSGTLYVFQRASPMYVGIAPFDPVRAGMLGSGADSFQQFVESRGWPQWSADGRHLMFESCGLAGGGPCSLFVRDGDAAPREVLHGMWYFAAVEVAPDGHAVLARGSDLKGRHGIFMIDAKTGETSNLVPISTASNAQWGSDGRTIRYTEPRGHDLVLLERDVHGEQSKEIYRTVNDRIQWMRVSPDGLQVAYVRRPVGEFLNEPGTLMVASLPAGTPRAVFASPGLKPQEWASDGQGIFVNRQLERGAELWRVPLSGSPVNLSVDPRADSLRVSPDGKHVAFVAQAGEPGNQIWALENVLP